MNMCACVQVVAVIVEGEQAGDEAVQGMLLDIESFQAVLPALMRDVSLERVYRCSEEFAGTAFDDDFERREACRDFGL